MTTAIIRNFEKLLAGGNDNTLLRFSLGNEYLKAGESVSAVNHLKQAVVLDPKYSAAWKLLGRALVESGQPADALLPTAKASRWPKQRATNKPPKK